MGLLFLSPIFALVQKSLHLPEKDKSNWEFVKSTMLFDLSFNSISLVFGTVTLSALISLILVLSLKSLGPKMQKVFTILLSLPLVFPVYVYAFVFLGIFEWASPLSIFLREQGIIEYLNVKNLMGGTIILSFAFYPYIFIPLSLKLKHNWNSLYLSSRFLGVGPIKSSFHTFRSLGLKPMLFGMTVIALEVISEFGGVSMLGLETFTTAIYTAWVSFYSIEIAVRLGLILLVPAFLLLFLEQIIDNLKSTQLDTESELERSLKYSKLQKIFSFTIALFFSILVLFVPLAHLGFWSLEAISLQGTLHSLFTHSLQSLLFGIGVPIFILAVIIFTSLIIKWTEFQRLSSRGSFKFVRVFRKYLDTFLQYGYGLPGNLLAVGVLGLAVFVYQFNLGESLTIVSIGFLVIALMVKFSRIAFKNINIGESEIKSNTEKISLILNQESFSCYIREIYFPLVKKYYFAAFFIIGVEVFKELPLTLILRPIGVNTLATKVFELASEGNWEICALFTLPIMLLGLSLKVFTNIKSIRRRPVAKS